VPSTLEQRALDAVRAEETPTRTGRRPSTRRPAAGPLLRGALVRLGLGSVGRRLWAPGIAVAVGALVVLGAVGVEMARLAQPPSAPGAAQVQTVQLVAIDGSGASGTASIERASAGQVVELKVRGLPDTSPGELYVCWLVGEDDSMQHENRVAVGTFRVSGSGPVTVRWSTGADTAKHRLDVTREKADGNPLRRGPEVLTAVN
jgi:Anti-sigma-K factor rskA